MREVVRDVMVEEPDQMAVILFNHFKSQIPSSSRSNSCAVVRYESR